LRYIIHEKDKGIFLGDYLGKPLFSNNLIFPIIKAYSFKTLEEAQDFVRNVLCPEIPRDGHRESVVEEMVCKNGESKW
jgi:hypothetical protein